MGRAQRGEKKRERENDRREEKEGVGRESSTIHVWE
jgi:hypothetical protein